MHRDGYYSTTDHHHETYEFLSEGPKGTIKKVVLYQEIDEDVFNLAFGDWDEKNEEIRDDTRTNNADRDKVLATVAATVVDFMEHHPDATVFTKGQTPAKTRLYQMGINNNWHEISELYEVQGFRDGEWESFEDDKNYEAFILKAR
jgi:hypothetical protein